MPSVVFSKDRVLNILGRKVDDVSLSKHISYLGTDLEEVNKKDIVVEIFPNRPDLLSEEGFARALKTFLGFSKGLKSYVVNKSDFEVVVDKSVSGVRPFTACLVAKNLSIDESVLNNIINLQEKLHVTFGRNRKKCAIGVYPFENIVFPIHYKALSPDKIRFVPLGETKEMNGFDLLKSTKAGKEYAHLLRDEKVFPLFTDSNDSVMSVPPILNSRNTGTVGVDTRHVFVECSGHDFGVVSKALNIIGCALADMGGDIFEVNINYKKEGVVRVTPDFSPDVLRVEFDYLRKYLGLDLKDDVLIGLVEKMGFGIKNKSGKFVDVLVPCYRADVIHPVDVVEDVCIAYGFDKVEGVMSGSFSVGKEIFKEKVQDKVRDVLVGDGLVEVVSYSLVKFDDQKFLGFNNVLSIKNPTSSEFDSLREFLVPSVLKTFKSNKMNEYPQRLFEVGRVFRKVKGVVEENNDLCVAICSDSASYTWAKQRLELLGSLFDLDLKFEAKSFNFFISGRSAEVKVKHNDKWLCVGFIGEVSLDVLRYYDLEHGVSLFELNIDLVSKIIEERIV
ncbi:phenylalanine--tRNA ligase subunit beta [Candidatus Woesearchaeota archaeon]|nr:phenylalanine--tRNA ligase subunit beta [Candidatus Woesearchaeota archaeon]